MVTYKKGRFRAEEITIREVGSLEIIFYDKETIYVIDTIKGVRYIFHRWFAPRKSYKEWNSFRSALWSSKHKQIGWYFEESATWEIPFTTTTRPLDLSDKKVRRLKWKHQQE